MAQRLNAISQRAEPGPVLGTLAHIARQRLCLIVESGAISSWIRGCVATVPVSHRTKPIAGLGWKQRLKWFMLITSESLGVPTLRPSLFRALGVPDGSHKGDL